MKVKARHKINDISNLGFKFCDQMIHKTQVYELKKVHKIYSPSDIDWTMY